MDILSGGLPYSPTTKYKTLIPYSRALGASDCQLNNRLMTKMSLIILFLFIVLNGQGQDITYDKVDIGCLNLTTFKKETVIRSNEEYNAILDNISPHPSCGSYAPPVIDFTKKVLLGFLINAGGCSPPKYETKVFRSGQNTVFSVEVIKQGMCKALFQKMTWITIDREFGGLISFESKVK